MCIEYANYPITTLNVLVIQRIEKRFKSNIIGTEQIALKMELEAVLVLCT